MPEREFITRMPGVKVIEICEAETIRIRGIAAPQPGSACPHCQAKTYRIKSSKWREFKHALWGRQQVVWEIRIPKLLCKCCGKYFTLRIPGILPLKRSTEQFRQDVFHRHQAGATQTHLAQTHGISSSTVERWYQDFVSYRVKELQGRSCPIVLGIDEHFFSRKQGFATTFVDLRNHRVFDVVLGKYEKDPDLKAFLEALPGRDQVKVVVMDLCRFYRRLVKKYFPNAMIVTDRFHVIRWINYQFLNAWKQIDPEGRGDRKNLGLMRRHEWNLKPEQKIELELYLQKHPEMRPIYDFKQDNVEKAASLRVTDQDPRLLGPTLNGPRLGLV